MPWELRALSLKIFIHKFSIYNQMGVSKLMKRILLPENYRFFLAVQ